MDLQQHLLLLLLLTSILVPCCCPCASCADGAAGGFRYFWLTDSCPQTVNAVQERKPFEVLTLAGPIAEALQI